MRPTIETIQDTVSKLRQDESLLFLNHVLGVARGHINDPRLAAEIAKLGNRPIAYVVHFIAMQLLLHSSVIGIRTLDWPQFIDLMNMLNGLRDPIEDHANPRGADPNEIFVRTMQQQLPSQDRNMLKKLGLYLGLFRDVGIADGYDLRREVESTIGMTIDEFMSLGFVCGAGRAASLGVGTFTPDFLTKAYAQGVKVCTPELWSPFWERVGCTPKSFKAKQLAFSAGSLAYPQFEFNLVRQFPIVEITPGKFVCVDPELVLDRVTYGLFYDLFDSDRLAFSQSFGAPFEKYVGMMLRTVVPPGSLWSHADWKAANPTVTIRGRVSDHVYLPAVGPILFECKSLRPNVKLITVADEASLAEITDRIAGALRQLIEHNEAIKSGRWVSAGIPANDAAAFIVVTYGQIYTINTVFWRDRIQKRLAEHGLVSKPFVVLSLSELDSVVKLVENGHSLEDVILELCDPLKSLHSFDELKADATSSSTKDRASRLMESITGRRT